MYYNLKLDIEPVTTLEQVLKFINNYWYIWPIEFNQLSFEDWIEFRWINSIDFFEWLLQLHLESAIDLEIKWQLENEFWRINHKLNKFLNNYLKESQPLLWFLTKKSKYYDIILLRQDFHLIKEDIKNFDSIWFNIRVNWRQFLTLLFCKITEYLGYNWMDINKISKMLYKQIIDETSWKSNYLWNIEIFYKFDDYLDNKRLVLPILSELENKWNISINNIKIEKEYIYFKISKVIDISEELFYEVWNQIINVWITKSNKWSKNETIEKFEYTKDWLLINSKKWTPKDSLKSEIFLRVLSNYFFDSPKSNEILVTDLNSYYLDNINELLFDIEENKRVKYLILNEKNIWNSYIKTINKKFNEDYKDELLQIGRWLIKKKKLVLV